VPACQRDSSASWRCHSSPSKPRVDGANRWQVLRHIVLPLMTPVIVVTVLIRFISAVKTYDLIYILTRGGPGTATEMIAYLIYRTGLAGPLDISQAAAGSLVLLLLTVTITGLLLATTDRMSQ
jgi:multiple sugar transport system permease protein